GDGGGGGDGAGDPVGGGGGPGGERAAGAGVRLAVHRAGGAVRAGRAGGAGVPGGGRGVRNVLPLERARESGGPIGGLSACMGTIPSASRGVKLRSTEALSWGRVAGPDRRRLVPRGRGSGAHGAPSRARGGGARAG